MAVTTEEFEALKANYVGKPKKEYPNSENVNMREMFTSQEAADYERENSPYNKDWKGITAFENGVKLLGKGVVDALRMGRDLVVEQEKQWHEDYHMNSLAASLDDVSKSETFKQDPVASATSWGQFGLDVAQGAGQFLPTLLVAPIGGAGGVAAINTLSIAGEEYNDLRTKGVDVYTAAEAAGANALIQLPLEYIGLSKVMKRLPIGSTMAGYGREFVERAMTEGVTEYLQEYPDEITRIWAQNAEKSPEEITDLVLNDLGNINNNALYSGAIGAVLGGAVGGAHIALSNRIQESIEREVHETKLDTIERQINDIAQNKVKPEVVAAVVDTNQGQTVYVDAGTVTTYAQEHGVPINDIAWSLGVDAEELKRAADDGDYMDVTLGRYEGTAAKHNGFFQATRNDVAFEDGGVTTNSIQQRQEAIQQDRERAEGLQVEQDKILSSLLRSGVNRTQANGLVTLYTNFAMVMNPEDPAKFLREHGVEFQKATNAAAAGMNQENQNFKNWFKNSKVVDKDGKPLVVYHGTPNGGFNEFNTKTAKNKKSKWQLMFGTHFAEEKDVAEGYTTGTKGARKKKTNPQLYPVHLSIQNMLDLTDINQAVVGVYTSEEMKSRSNEEMFNKIKAVLTPKEQKKFIQKGRDGEWIVMENVLDGGTTQRAEEIVRALGYDGLKYNARHGDGRGYVENPAYIVLDSNQVKSVDNNGQYSLIDNNIYSQMAGEIGAARLDTTLLRDLRDAKDMLAEGKSLDEIWDSTGWTLGKDGKWRFEIPDDINNIDWTGVKNNSTRKLSDIYYNPRLYAAYPALADMRVVMFSGGVHANGFTNGETIHIKYKDPTEYDDAMSQTLIHEIQHCIQRREGFAAGGGPETVFRTVNDLIRQSIVDGTSGDERIKALKDKVIAISRAKRAGDNETVETELHDLYMALGGEQEARMTARRAEQRKELKSGALIWGLYFEGLGESSAAAEEIQGRSDLDARTKELATEYIDACQEEIADEESYFSDELLDLLASENPDLAEELQTKMQHVIELGVAADNLRDKSTSGKIGRPESHASNAIIVFNDTNIPFDDEGPAPQGNAEIKGSFNPVLQDGQYIISLFQGADASTVIHETGHYFVESMWEMIRTGEATGQMVKDFETLMKYCGTTTEKWAAADIEGRRAAHEKLAEGFETYIMEGKAPSQQLRRVFQNFANWVKAVYQSIVRNDNAAPITDEVRQVFDRMLAVDEDIREAERISGYFNDLPNVVTANMSDATRNRVENFIAKARDKAVTILTRHAMENFSEERKQRVAEFRARILPEVEAAVKDRRVYKTGYTRNDARKYARLVNGTGRTSNVNEQTSTEDAMADVELNTQQEMFVMQFDLVAEASGYSSGSEMVQDILNSPTEKQAITSMLNARVREEFPDYMTDKHAHEEAVREAMYNDDTGLLIGVEQQLIRDYAEQQARREQQRQNRQQNGEQQNQNTPPEATEAPQGVARTPAQVSALAAAGEAELSEQLEHMRTMEDLRIRAAAFRQKARNIARDAVSRMIIKDAVRSQKYVTLERKAAVQSAVAMKNHDYQEAYRQKNLQAYYHAMVQETMRARKLVEKNRRYLKRQVAAKREAWVSEAHFAEASRLFERMGIARSKHANAEGRIGTTLREYMEAMNEKYDNAEFAEWLLNLPDGESLADTRMYTLAQFDDMTNAIRNIRAIAKAEKGVNMFGKAKSFEELKAKILEEIGKLPVVFKPNPNNPTQATILQKMAAAMETIDTFFAKMDGEKVGWFTNTFLTRIKQANDSEFIHREKYDKAVVEANQKWAGTKEQRAAVNEQVYYEELGTSVSRHILVKMLINMGNKENAQRLCETVPIGFEKNTLWTMPSEDDGVTRQAAAEETAKNILEFLGKNLTKSDVQYAQDLVNAAEMFWTEKQALEIKLKGFGMKKVEATPRTLNIRGGQAVLRGEEVIFQGGYFPLMRNTEMGSHPANQEVSDTDPLQGRNIRTLHTNQGSTKSRTGAKYPVNLYPGAETQVMYDSIHDLCWRECVNDYRRVLNDQELFTALKTHLGPARMRVFREMLEKAAQPYNSYSADLAEQTIGAACSWMRNKTSCALIMMNIKVNMQNLGNILLYGNAVEGFGHKDVFAALGNWKMNFASAKGYSDLTDFVLSKSAFMRERTVVPDITIRDIQDDLSQKQTELEKWVTRVGSRMLSYTDGLTAKPVWAQAYQKAIGEGKTEQEAIDFADMVIRRTLGSVRMTDVSSLQRGGPIFKMLTMFQSFFNTQYNQWIRELRYDQKLRMEGREKEAYERAFSFIMAKYLVTCMASLALGLQNPFGTDDEDEWLKLAKEMKSYPLSMLGPAGQVASSAIGNLLGMQEFDYRMSVVQSTLDKAAKLGKTATRVADGKATVAEGVESVTNIAGMVVGVPAQANKIFWNLYDVLFNDMQPQLEDLVKRRPKKERKEK